MFHRINGPERATAICIEGHRWPVEVTQYRNGPWETKPAPKIVSNVSPANCPHCHRKWSELGPAT